MSWLEDHNKLYGDDGVPKRLPPAKTDSPVERDFAPFRILRVTQAASDVVKDLEQALMHTLASATKGEQSMADAYELLCVRRTALYAHIEELEAQLGIERPVTLRFL